MNEQQLQHYGILGMKWGVRRERGPDGRVGTSRAEKKQAEKAYRAKLKAIGQNKEVNAYDRRVAKEARSGRLAVIVNSSAPMIVRTALMQSLGAKAGQTLTPAEQAIVVGHIAKNTAILTALTEKKAKLVSARYDDDGNLLPGEKNKATPSALALDLATLTAVIGLSVGSKSLKAHAAQRKANQAAYEAWGKNVLSEKASLPFIDIPKEDYTITDAKSRWRR